MGVMVTCERRYIMIQLGIDVGKSKIDLCLLPEGAKGKKKTKVLKNSPSVATDVISWLLTKKVDITCVQAVLEPTGTYHEYLAYGLHEQGIRVVLGNPLRVRDYARGMGILTKTDTVDSYVLACYGEMRNPDPWVPASPSVRELKELLRRRDALLKDSLREENRLEKILSTRHSPLVEASVCKMITVLKTELGEIEKLINDHIDRDPDLKRDMGYLTSIKGIGPQTGSNMLVVLRSHNFNSAQQAAAWCGLVPKEKRSGSSVHFRARLSKSGPPRLRAKLFICALVAMKHNRPLKVMYERMLANGKCKMSALGAVMRKLVHQCYAVLRHQCNFDENIGAAG